MMYSGQAAAADEDAIQMCKLELGILFKILQQHKPHGGYGGGKGHLLCIQQFVDGCAIQFGAGHHHLAARHRAAEGQRPGIGMEHGHNGQDRIAARNILGVGKARRQRVKHIGTVRIDARPSDCRWCR